MQFDEANKDELARTDGQRTKVSDGNVIWTNLDCKKELK